MECGRCARGARGASMKRSRCGGWRSARRVYGEVHPGGVCCVVCVHRRVSCRCSIPVGPYSCCRQLLVEHSLRPAMGSAESGVCLMYHPCGAPSLYARWSGTPRPVAPRQSSPVTVLDGLACHGSARLQSHRSCIRFHNCYPARCSTSPRYATCFVML